MEVEKRTLLNIIGGLDKYTSGDMALMGRSTKEFKDRDWDSYRNGTIGFVFQSYNFNISLKRYWKCKISFVYFRAF